MDGELIKKTLCFHGKPMQKIWDDERGAGDLRKLGVPEDGNYAIYMERQKHFTFQDRAKRLKLHQFLSRKALDLYDKDLLKLPANPIKVPEDSNQKNMSMLARLPPYETFLTKHADKIKRTALESIKDGEIIYAQVMRTKKGISSPIWVKPLCTDIQNFRLLHDYNIKSIIPPNLCGQPVVDKWGIVSSIEVNDYLRCEVIEFSVDAERMTLSLMPHMTPKTTKLGKISQDELPHWYSKLVEHSGTEKFDSYLRSAREFENPNYDILYAINGLDVNDNFSLMSDLKYGFPRQEYAKELRELQASKWAFRSVAEGIEYFKIGQHVEAFQCLNKALQIDPRNVEGLVARGALYANKGSFLKAVEDFEKALKLNANHVNARKYMGETLVALGRSYEEDNRIQDAAKAYRDCLNIIPMHEQAALLLEAIQQRTGASVDPIPSALARKSYDKVAELDRPQSLSNDSNSEDSSSASNTEDDNEIVSKKENSLSPLSKKMALHAQQLESSGADGYNQPFYKVIPNEFKLDEDDTETRVRKLIDEANKHKKVKKKSKESKKSKKSKKTQRSKESSKQRHEYDHIVERLKTEDTLNANLKQYERSIQEIKRKQLGQADQPTTSSRKSHSKERGRSETPPPPPKFSRDQEVIEFGISAGQKYIPPRTSAPAVAPAIVEPNAPRFSFQIKRPIKMDKFGLICLATPMENRTPTPSPEQVRRLSRSPSPARSGRLSRSRTRTRSKSRSRRRRSRSVSAGGRRRWRSRTRSRSRDRLAARRGRGARSRSRTRSPTPARRRRRSRSRSDSRNRRRRRTPSPFVPRGTPSPRRRDRRSPFSSHNRGYRGRGIRGRGGSRGSYGNRIWRNPNAPHSPDRYRRSPSPGGRWEHDKYNRSTSDDPTIEEIDEIISKAQKERKQNIINNDKDILKRTNKW